jgi:hypothetical protein
MGEETYDNNIGILFLDIVNYHIEKYKDKYNIVFRDGYLK